MPRVKVLACTDCGRNLVVKQTRGDFRRRTCSEGHTHFTNGDEFTDSSAFYYQEGVIRHLRETASGKLFPRPAPPEKGRVFVKEPDRLATGHTVVETAEGGKVYQMRDFNERTFKPRPTKHEALGSELMRALFAPIRIELDCK